MRTTGNGAWRDRSGFCGVEPLAPAGAALRPAQLRALAGIAARVRLSHDLLAEFADRYAAFPAQLVLARTRELTALHALLDRYGTAERGPVLDAGELRSRGRRSRADALDVSLGLADEMIAVLSAALTGLAAADVRSVYLAMLWAAHRQRRLAQAWGARSR